jgi:hypothetical protein
VQEVSLFGFNQQEYTKGVFDIDDNSLRNAAYVVQSKFSGQPDILVVSQRQAASAADMRAFIIDDGALCPVEWQWPGGRTSKRLDTSGGRFTALSSLTFESHGWARSIENTGPVDIIWWFDIARRVFVFDSDILSGKFGNKDNLEVQYKTSYYNSRFGFSVDIQFV